MVSDKRNSNVVGGKTARPCDGCVKKRARWYCAADDAFLCQSCDLSVHSANPLASRHERVRLKTASNKILLDVAPIPTWQQGFTKKPRTPRMGKHLNHNLSKSQSENMHNSFPLVPEIGLDESSSTCGIEEQLVFQVPTYESEFKSMGAGFFQDDEKSNGVFSNDMDLEEFAANVESLLGTGLENECFGIEELGLRDYKQNNSDHDCSSEGGFRVKHEEQEENVTLACSFDMNIDPIREPFELDFDYDSPTNGQEEEEKKVVNRTISTKQIGEVEEGEEKKLLRLDYESVIKAWGDSRRSPWTNGTRPQLDQSWPYFLGNEVQYAHGETSGMGVHKAIADEGREARVSRYREKRRTRLFSKKIRYEVRKLNAEKRPRMKGRFVKRVSLGVPGFPILNR